MHRYPDLAAALAAAAVITCAAPLARADHDEAPPGRIAFASAGPSTDVWTMNTDGSDATDLTPTAGADLWPAYSPDGARIAFIRGAGLARELWIMDADGTGRTRITTNTSGDNAPDWSPDGRHIAVARVAPDSTVDLWVLDVEGIDADLRLTADAAFDAFPSWSPDGEWIAFASNRGGVDAVWRLRADGTGGLERLTPPEMHASTPEWSHDGKVIAFCDNVCPTCDESDLWVLKLSDRKLFQVTDTPENELFPDWSPDDKWLVYERADIIDGALDLPDIFVTSVKHGGARNLTNSPDALDFMPAWMP